MGFLKNLANLTKDALMLPVDSDPCFSSEDYTNIVIAKVKKKHLYYYKNLNRYKIPIDELENIIVTGPIGSIEFYNQYDYQKYIEEEKLKQSNII